MNLFRAVNAAPVFLLVLALAGCGTPQEKTAPCKRPDTLASYAADILPNCGPMAAVNEDPKAALAAIDEFASSE